MFKMVSFLFLLLLTTSCSTPSKPKLTKQMKKEVEALFSKSMDSIKLELELSCDDNYKRFYQHAIDSIQTLRQEEIESIINQ